MQYAKRIIGFDVLHIRVSHRQIRAVLFDQKSKYVSASEATAKESLQSALPRKTSKIIYM